MSSGSKVYNVGSRKVYRLCRNKFLRSKHSPMCLFKCLMDPLVSQRYPESCVDLFFLILLFHVDDCGGLVIGEESKVRSFVQDYTKCFQITI